MSFPSTLSVTPTKTRAASRAVFFIALAFAYTAAIVIATLALNPYFAQTWDVQTFIQVGHRFLDGGNPFDLYAVSRTAQTWPYAYPPLHALVTALALAIGNLVPISPDYVWARLPMILADIGVAMVLYFIVRRKANDEMLARIAAMLWLFNPITFYDTAVQGHFESEWLLFVLLAYYWFENSRSIIFPSIALAVAVLFKQTAIIFAVPLWAIMFVRIFQDRKQQAVSRQRSAVALFASVAIFAGVFLIVCLPYLLYSNDFLYMNLTYVENVPVQTQSWLIAILGLTRAAPNVMTTDFFLLRYQTIVTIIAVSVIAFIGARRGWGLYLTATLIAIAFFLTSKKVMGYYYVMLFPFLLAELVPHARWKLVSMVTFAVTYISLSPYYAAWTNHDHWWVYAILGMINSAFFVWLLRHLSLRGTTRSVATKQSPTMVDANAASSPQTSRLLAMTTLIITLGLFAGAAGAAILQPIIASTTSPIRAPIVAAGMETSAMIAFTALIGIILLTMWIANRLLKSQARAWFVFALLFAPLFFSVYTLTKESTAIFEIALKALGV